LRLVELNRLETKREVLDWLQDRVGKQPCFAGMDAPVLVRNMTGMRPADRMAHQLFSKQHAGCYPVNLGMPFAEGILGFVEELRAAGFSPELPREAQSPGRHIFEVYPHASSIRLFGLEQILPYKKGRLEERRLALRTFRDLLGNGLAARRPSFRPAALPEIPMLGRDLKVVEDQLDAVLCAYTAAHFWYWGWARNNLLGDERSGAIVIPSF
jgi:predicted RNase H-like nuclease